MIQQINQNIQNRFKIGKPNFLKVPKVQNFGKLKSRFIGKLNKLQSQYGLKDSDRLGMYHESFWKEYVFNASPTRIAVTSSKSTCRVGLPLRRGESSIAGESS